MPLPMRSILPSASSCVATNTGFDEFPRCDKADHPWRYFSRNPWTPLCFVAPNRNFWGFSMGAHALRLHARGGEERVLCRGATSGPLDSTVPSFVPTFNNNHVLGVSNGVSWFCAWVRQAARLCAGRVPRRPINTGDFRYVAFYCTRLQRSLPGF